MKISDMPTDEIIIVRRATRDRIRFLESELGRRLVDEEPVRREITKLQEQLRELMCEAGKRFLQPRLL